MDIKIKKNGNNFKKIFRILAEKSFLFSLCLVLLSLIVGGFVFYKYYILVVESEPEASEITLKLKNQAYEDIIKTWEERQKKITEADFKNYINPFLGF